MASGLEMRHAVGRLTSALAFGGSIAAMVLLLGTRDMEDYEHAFFSLDRGTAVQAVHALGQPVYTLAIGLGVRLPLQSGLGASPAAAIAPYLPAPLTYWVLMTFSIAAAVMVARHALEPVCGRLVSWLAVALLFCSVPIVNYTFSEDWPASAVTYCAFVGCVFAPHALLALLDSQGSSTARRLAGLSVAGTVWGLVGLVHAGFWPLLAVTLVLTATLALGRSDHPFRTRFTVVAALAAVSLMAVALQLPDLVRDLNAASEAGEMRRFVRGPTGSVISANLFPFGQVGARMPFTYLVMALVSLVIGLTSKDAHARRLIVGSALMSMVLGVGAATLSPGSAVYAPSATFALRDPATAFAVLSAACAAGAVRRSRGATHFVGAGLAIAALVLGGLLGPWYAARVVLREVLGASDRSPWTWNQDMTAPDERTSIRGLARDRASPGERLALYAGVRSEMHNVQDASTDFADAGYLLVTARTKQRTMRGLVEPNEWLFSQTTDLPSEVLCDSSAVRFLRLRYLLIPPDVECRPWTLLPGPLVDDWLELRVAAERDEMVRALPVASVSEPVAREPALSAGSLLLPALVPLSGTSLSLGAGSVAIRLDDSSSAAGRALVLPVAYDSAWRTSSGRVHNVGGLLALIGVDQRQVTVDYVPDLVAVLRAASMTIAQLLAVVGFLGLACVRPLQTGRRNGTGVTSDHAGD